MWAGSAHSRVEWDQPRVRSLQGIPPSIAPVGGPASSPAAAVEAVASVCAAAQELSSGVRPCTHVQGPGSRRHLCQKRCGTPSSSSSSASSWQPSAGRGAAMAGAPALWGVVRHQKRGPAGAAGRPTRWPMLDGQAGRARQWPRCRALPATAALPAVPRPCAAVPATSEAQGRAGALPAGVPAGATPPPPRTATLGQGDLQLALAAGAGALSLIHPESGPAAWGPTGEAEPHFCQPVGSRRTAAATAGKLHAPAAGGRLWAPAAGCHPPARAAGRPQAGLALGRAAGGRHRRPRRSRRRPCGHDTGLPQQPRL